LKHSRETRNVLPMPIFIFWSEADKAVFGFTADTTGDNLPANLAPWSRNGTGEPIAGEGTMALAAANPVIQAVERDGFYIGRAAATVTRAKWPE
jgi:hypothetical protein